MKKEMKVGTQTFLGKTMVGIVWIIAGIMHCFDSIAILFVRLLLSATAVILLVVVLRSNVEHLDEMAKDNMMRAKAKTCEVMQLIFFILAIVLIAAAFLQTWLEFEISVNLLNFATTVVFCLIGIQYFLTGVFFRKLEAE